MEERYEVALKEHRLRESDLHCWLQRAPAGQYCQCEEENETDTQRERLGLLHQAHLKVQ